MIVSLLTVRIIKWKKRDQVRIYIWNMLSFQNSWLSWRFDHETLWGVRKATLTSWATEIYNTEIAETNLLPLDVPNNQLALAVEVLQVTAPPSFIPSIQ